MYKYLDLPVEVYEEYFETLFFRFYFSDIHCSERKGGVDQNRMAKDVKGGEVEIFDFADVINEWPLNERLVETR